MDKLILLALIYGFFVFFKWLIRTFKESGTDSAMPAANPEPA